MLLGAFLTRCVLLASVVVGVKIDFARKSDSEFDAYVVTFKRGYRRNSEEYHRRKAIFEHRLQEITAHNAQPGRLWSAGINDFTDLLDEEFVQKMGYRPSVRGGGRAPGASALEYSHKTLPDEVDWRSLHMASHVPDQGACGSCWAFAAASLLQARYEIEVDEQRTFAAQELINCVANPQNCGGQGGCSGATVELAIAYVEQKGSLNTIHSMPYEGENGTCETSNAASMLMRGVHGIVGSTKMSKRKDLNAFVISSWQKLESNSLSPLMNAIQDGPVAISAGANSWSTYETGIFDSCDQDVIVNHAVMLFGYGTEDNTMYWLVRNSWGSSWGESGYIRLLRHDQEGAYCGTDSAPEEGVECEPYPDSVTVCGMCGVLYDSVELHFESEGDNDFSSDSSGSPSMDSSGNGGGLGIGLAVRNLRSLVREKE